MEQTAQVNRYFGRKASKNDKICLQENFWSHGTEPLCIYHPNQGW